MSFLRKRGKYWYYYWYDGGGRKHGKSLRVELKVHARELKKKLDMKYAAKRLGLNVSQNDQPVKDMALDFRRRIAKEKSESYADNVRISLNWLQEFMGEQGLFNVSDISSQVINGFIPWRLDKVKKKTLSNDLSVIKRFLRYCNLENCPIREIDWDNFAEYMNVKSKNHIPPFSKEQLQVIFDWDVVRVPYFKTMYYTGLDSIDVRHLHENNIYVDEHYGAYIELESRRKTRNSNGRSLIIPIHPAIDFLVEGEGYLFPLLHKSQTAIDNAYHQLKEFIRKQDWNDRLCVKSFRHSFNQHLKVAGIKYEDRQSFMGHAAGSDTTRSYEHELPELLPAKRRMIEQLHISNNE